MVKKDRGKILFFIFSVIFGMFGLAFASVPIYRVFCKVTGYGGYVNRYDFFREKKKIGHREITISFNADVMPDIPLKFSPDVQSVKVMTGEQKLIFYTAEDTADYPVEGMAVYNVTPFKAAKYFYKVACFCFTRQSFVPYQKVSMPVVFIVEPAIEDDPEMNDVHEMTLSYTFFQYKE